MLVTHANIKGLDLTPLFGVHCGFMPLQLKQNKKQIAIRIKREKSFKENGNRYIESVCVSKL